MTYIDTCIYYSIDYILTPLILKHIDKVLPYLYYVNRFALIYQLTKPIVKKITAQTSVPDGDGTKTAVKGKGSSADGSCSG